MNIFIYLFFSGGNARFYNTQRYHQRQNFQNHPQSNSPNMFHPMPTPYMIQTPGDGMQSIINHKFFQSRGLPNSSNPCAYQSSAQGQTAAYNPLPAVQYYQYTQPPTAAVQQ